MDASSLTTATEPEPGFTEEQDRAHEIASYSEDDLGQFLDNIKGRDQQQLIQMLLRVREEHQRRAKEAVQLERMVRMILHDRANLGISSDMAAEGPMEPTRSPDGYERAEASIMPERVRTPDYVRRVDESSLGGY